jgi:hypothetical protein
MSVADSFELIEERRRLRMFAYKLRELRDTAVSPARREAFDEACELFVRTFGHIIMKEREEEMMRLIEKAKAND